MPTKPEWHANDHTGFYDKDEMDAYLKEIEPRWTRYKDQKPPIGERVLVLVDGEIHEGFLHQVDLAVSGPTVFQTVFTFPRCSLRSAQHMSWGEDPYWMTLPAAKPQQERSEKKELREVRKASDDL